MVAAFCSGVGSQGLDTIKRGGYDFISRLTHEINSSSYFSGAHTLNNAGASGASTIVFTFDDPCTNCTAGALYMKNVYQGGPSSAREYSQGTTLSIDKSSTADGLVVDAVMNQDDADLNVGSGQTEHWDHDQYQNAWDYGSGSYEAATGPSTTMSWTVGSSSWNVQLVIAFRSPDVEVEQEGFRFRNDNADEIDATWKKAQDTNDTWGKGNRVRLRINRDYVDEPDTETVALQYKKSGDDDAEYRDVPLT